MNRQTLNIHVLIAVETTSITAQANISHIDSDSVGGWRWKLEGTEIMLIQLCSITVGLPLVAFCLLSHWGGLLGVISIN
jgi:predicted secreted protein